jgi:methylated-DNA-[protein]-cysteine S-methyltransferase
MGIISSSLGLKKIILPQKSKEEALLDVKCFYNLVKENDFAHLADLLQRLRRYLTGELVDFPDKLDLEGASYFQQRVWAITQTIPYGATRSYAWVACRIGYDKAARAVGQALGKNPLPIIIPCHRVISSGGSLGGFSAGLELKKYLLRLEAAK